MVDAMLGRLARWLRILGCDAAFDAEISDSDLVRGALEEDLRSRSRPFTRCSRCNTELEEAKPEQVAALVPPRVLRAQRRFVRCPSCQGVYWEGSHTDRMRRILDEL
jgi:uncharacterized protein with PIN domain